MPLGIFNYKKKYKIQTFNASKGGGGDSAPLYS